MEKNPVNFSKKFLTETIARFPLVLVPKLIEKRAMSHSPVSDMPCSKLFIKITTYRISLKWLSLRAQLECSNFLRDNSYKTFNNQSYVGVFPAGYRGCETICTHFKSPRSIEFS